MVYHIKNKKIIIVHNSLDNIGGAERVTCILARELCAPIITTNVNKKKLHKMGFHPKINSVGITPKNPPWKQQLALFYFSFFKSASADITIVAGDWAVSAANNNVPCLWYVHSPMRELWDLYDYTLKNVVPVWQRPFFVVWAVLNRFLVKKYANKVTKLVCNSKTVQLRINKYLGRDAIIIHPPVDTKKYYYKENGSFWLSVNRLINHKQVELQIEAFRNMPNEKLVLVGSYEKASHFLRYKKELKKKLPSNITFLNNVSEEELIKLYASCKGFLTTSKEEDFGLTVVEAMASGKPVIAPAKGGFLETIIDGKTGILINDLTVKNIIKAISTIGDVKLYKSACVKQAKKFDTVVFMRKMNKAMGDVATKE